MTPRLSGFLRGLWFAACAILGLAAAIAVGTGLTAPAISLGGWG